ncbi:MAG TPA: hypothetical protein VN372_02155 [Methanospirillum sp.]|nr:hypothetical protein [Methanospirillum sp.]
MKNTPTLWAICALILITVLIAGCTSPSQDQAPARTTPPTSLPTSHATVIQTIEPEGTSSVESSMPETFKTPAPGLLSFTSERISLEYPDQFHQISEESLGKVQAVAKSQGLDILMIFNAADSKDAIQIVQLINEASVDKIYADKAGIADEVLKNGTFSLNGMTFVSYDVQKTALTDGTQAVKVTAENSAGGAAVSYLITSAGYEYDVNFIYESLKRAEEQSEVRDGVIRSVTLT